MNGLRSYTPAMRRGNLRSFTLLAAIFAVLMAAFAPAISQAMQRGGGADQVLVCTQFGSKWIQADTGVVGGKKSPFGSEHSFEHCPYCSVHAASLGMPPAVVQPLPLPLSYALHWRYSAATPTLEFWSNALSRGPPSRA